MVKVIMNCSNLREPDDEELIQQQENVLEETSNDTVGMQAI